MTVSGAYGRDYKSLKEAKADWENGKDFVIRDVFSGSGSYVSKRDVGNMKVWIRYKKDYSIAKLQ